MKIIDETTGQTHLEDKDFYAPGNVIRSGLMYLLITRNEFGVYGICNLATGFTCMFCNKHDEFIQRVKSNEDQLVETELVVKKVVSR